MQLNREDIELTTSDDGPVLRVGETEILLRTVLYEDGGDGWNDSAQLVAGLESDGDNGSWWNLEPEDGRYPWLSIQPEILTDQSSSAYQDGER